MNNKVASRFKFLSHLCSRNTQIIVYVVALRGLLVPVIKTQNVVMWLSVYSKVCYLPYKERWTDDDCESKTEKHNFIRCT